MIVRLTPLGVQIRLTAMRERADQGAGPAQLEFYAEALPGTPGAAPGPTPLLVIVLAKPCGGVVDGELILIAATSTGDLALLDGSAVSGRMVCGDGAVLFDGDVTDNSGNGFFKITGSEGVALHAGGRVRLGETRIT